MQNAPSIPPLDWRSLVQWVLAIIIAGGGIGVVVNNLLNRRRNRVEGDESVARANKTAGETFHLMLEDLTQASERLVDLRDKNDACKDEVKQYKALLENAERKERRRLHQEAQRPRVLLVDDQDEMRELVYEKFRLAPFKLEVAHDGQDALEQYDDAIRLGFPFKLLVLDYAMPGLSGLDVAKKIRESGDALTKFIIWTAYPAHTVAQDTAGLGIEKIITKEVPAELECAILGAVGLTGAHYGAAMDALKAIKPEG